MEPETTSSLVTDDARHLEQYILKACTMFRDRMPASFAAAEEEFLLEVDPYVMYLDAPCERDIKLVSVVFFEWFAFDYDAGAGKTPLRLYAETLSKQGMSRLHETLVSLIQTQFFSEFWVLSQDPVKSISLLADAFTGKLYSVKDDAVAHTTRWSQGLLGIRIARMHENDSWHVVGHVPFHDTYPRREDFENPRDLLSIHPEGLHAVEGTDAVRFLDCVRELIGIRGRFRSSAEVNYL